ncbi:unnamed protein product, partial [Ectocarpus sp. 13 AM-2016]
MRSCSSHGARVLDPAQHGLLDRHYGYRQKKHRPWTTQRGHLRATAASV